MQRDLAVADGVVLVTASIDHAAALAALVGADRAHLHAFMPALASLSTTAAAAEHLAAAQAHGSAAAFEWHLFIDGGLAGGLRLKHIDLNDRKAQVGYFLGSGFTGKGHMTLALRAVLAFAFEGLGLHRVELRCAAGNLASARLAARLGFMLEGVLRQEQCLHGVFVDHRVYGLLRDEFCG